MGKEYTPGKFVIGILKEYAEYFQESKMKAYVGTKIVNAEPMSKIEFDRFKKGHPIADQPDDEAGYKVVYPDGYISWSPKEVFEAAYREINSGEVNAVLHHEFHR